MIDVRYCIRNVESLQDLRSISSCYVRDYRYLISSLVRQKTILAS